MWLGTEQHRAVPKDSGCQFFMEGTCLFVGTSKRALEPLIAEFGRVFYENDEQCIELPAWFEVLWEASDDRQQS